MTLLEEEIVGRCGCVVLVSQQALPRKISIITQSDSLFKDICVDGDIMLSHQNALHWRMAVQSVKLMPSNLIQPEPLIAGSQQSLEDVPGEGRNIMRDFVVERKYLLVEERGVGILRGEEGTSNGRVPQIMA